MIHPARLIPYDQLYANLQEAVSVGQVYEKINHESGLALYCYSDQTVYERQWHPITMLARGLILDTVNQYVVATPFPKFFNYQEFPSLPMNIQDAIPLADFTSKPFEVFEKLDGSLIIIYHHGNKWRAATKGSLSSDQALWAKALLDQQDLSMLSRGTTYLAEAIYPENRIVVNYGPAAHLTLLGAYDPEGHELSHTTLTYLGKELGWPVAQIYQYSSIEELLTHSDTLDSNTEGFVVRSISGHRLKIKGSEYCRVHRLVSNLTPLSIWRGMRDQEDLDLIRRSLPEEFLIDYDNIHTILTDYLNQLLNRIAQEADKHAHLSDKEVGLMLHDIPPHVRSFVFPFRKYQENILQNPRSRNGIFEAIRPNSNYLPGYERSSNIARAQENE